MAAFLTKRRRAPRKKYDAGVRAAMEGWCHSAMRWGVDDCALAIAAIDIAVTGIDTAAHFRGRYRSERGARRVLGRGGLPKALRAAARRQGWKRIDPRKARSGDRALVRTPAGPAVAIFYGGFWVGRIDFGFATRLRGDALMAWGI